MNHLKMVLKLFLFQAFIMVPIGCSSKGAILYSSLTVDQIDSYTRETGELVNSSADKLEVIFHQAGSFQEYAKNVNSQDFNYSFCPSSTKDVTALMDRSFHELQADGIEIDAQTIPENQNYTNVYIVHDKIDESKLSDMAKAYLANNSLGKVLTHFIEQRYFDPQKNSPLGKYLFIELKVPKKRLYLNHSPLNSKQKEYIEQIITKIQTTIKSVSKIENERVAIRRHIGFASFNLYALEYAHTFSRKQMQEGFSFYFIAGTNRGLIGYLANVFFSHEINYLDTALKKRLISRNWLTGIWFDPAGIDGIAKTFNNINKERGKPLSIFISTYKLKREDYFRRLREDHSDTDAGQSVKLNHVRGLFFDIQVCDD